MRDKPGFVRDRDRFKPRDRERSRQRFRCALAAVADVDESVIRIRERLAELGELDETVFVFTSDNGFLFGEHRIVDGKGVPFEEAIRVPLLIDLPPRYGNQQEAVDVQVSNLDLNATFRQLARSCPTVAFCRASDGIPLRGLMRGSRSQKRTFAYRPLLIEADQGKPCPFRGVRLGAWIYVEYPPSSPAICEGLERSLYDLEADPGQLENLLASRPDREAKRVASVLRNQLRRLEDCGGGRPGRACAAKVQGQRVIDTLGLGNG